MNISLTCRVVSFLSYFTFGFFGIIWLVYVNLTGKRMDAFVMFNIFQAIFISVLLAIVSLVYDIAINLISAIPFIGAFVEKFDIIFSGTPLYFTFTISGLIVTLLVIYLSVLSLLGKRPYIPVVSDVVRANFGG